MRDEKLDVARGPEVADSGATEVAYEAYIGYDEACKDDEDERRSPGRDFVRADTEVR